MIWEESKLQVRELMSTDVAGLKVDDRLRDAVQTLADVHVHGAPVLDGQGRLVGVLSSSDVLEAVAECEDAGACDRMLEETTVGDLMTPKPATIAPAQTVREAAQVMFYRDVHRLFVEEEGKLVGIISQSDIVRAVGGARI